MDFFGNVIIGMVFLAYIWGLWRCFPFFEIHNNDLDKPYFHQRIKVGNGEDCYVPRWYAFSFFLNVAIFAAVAWLAVWILVTVVHHLT